MVHYKEIVNRRGVRNELATMVWLIRILLFGNAQLVVCSRISTEYCTVLRR
jgi:hypothetical protein